MNTCKPSKVFSTFSSPIDDLIDCKGDSRIVGKPTARDQKKGKATLVNLLGYKKTILFAKDLKKRLPILANPFIAILTIIFFINP